MIQLILVLSFFSPSSQASPSGTPAPPIVIRPPIAFSTPTPPIIIHPPITYSTPPPIVVTPIYPIHIDMPLEDGIPQITSKACQNLSPDSFVGMCSAFSTCNYTQYTCGDSVHELFAGVTLFPSSRPNPSWNNFGGRGEAMTNAAICMLKDLSQNPVDIVAPSSKFRAEQKIGFINFDPVAKSFSGYQQLHSCMPVIGCFDSMIQPFSAKVVKSNFAFPYGLSCGDYPIQSAYSLQLQTEDSSRGFDAKGPEIDIPTPYGTAKAYPALHYQSSVQSISMGPDYAVAQFNNSSRNVQISDLYGRVPGTKFEANPSGDPYGNGWSSSLGIGSRDANPSDQPWSGSGQAARPDLNLALARNATEELPTSYSNASINIKDDLTGLLPAEISNNPLVNITFDVFIAPTIITQYTSQLQVLFSESKILPLDIGSGGTQTQSKVSIKSRVETNGKYVITAGLDLDITLHLLFSDLTLFKFNPSIPIPLGNPDYQHADSVEAMATMSNAPGTPVRFDQFQTFGSRGANIDGNAYINQCLLQSAPPQAKPTPSQQPGNIGELGPLQIPCNICAGNPEYHGTGKGNVPLNLTPNASLIGQSPIQDTTWDCSVQHLGCYDMCEWDTVTNKIGAVTQTALQMNILPPSGLKCNQYGPR